MTRNELADRIRKRMALQAKKRAHLDAAAERNFPALDVLTVQFGSIIPRLFPFSDLIGGPAPASVGSLTAGSGT